MGKSRFIWEQIMDDPDIYRISEVGSRQNCYLVASKGEMLVIDPRSKEMLRSVRRLSRSFNVQRGMYRIFLTGIPDEGLMGACDACGFCMSGEMYSVLRMKPDTILAGLKLRM